VFVLVVAVLVSVIVPEVELLLVSVLGVDEVVLGVVLAGVCPSLTLLALYDWPVAPWAEPGLG
jgi:hypothetical protein